MAHDYLLLVTEEELDAIMFAVSQDLDIIKQKIKEDDADREDLRDQRNLRTALQKMLYLQESIKEFYKR